VFAHVQVKSVFQVFETSCLYWDNNVPGCRERSGVYVAHLFVDGPWVRAESIPVCGDVLEACGALCGES
jgi:hypothetical protein